MQALWVISVSLHILAAVTWIGGMFFLMLVVVPWLRAGDRPNAAAFLQQTGERFRNVGWTCFGILLITGTFNLWVRGVRLADFTHTEWLRSSFGETVLVKLGAFTTVVLVSAVHDFVLGPRATAAIARDPHSREAQSLRRQASLIGRVNVVLALVLVTAAVMLVRGVPW